MPLHLYDTLTRVKRDFVPVADREVHLYVCGVTPYDTTHAGHARTYLVFDVLTRHLIDRGMGVRYVQNITDVDESILQRAEQLGEPYTELGARYTKIFLEDLAALGMLPPSEFPRATSAIEEMQEVVRRLLAGGHAYRVGRDVYFRVNSVEYGKLSRLDRARMLAIEAEQDDSTVDDDRKEDPLDFVLWRSVDGRGPAWDSPWGPGRPGWHLECSTLALKHLGRTIDIHGGGEDLVFPHHECELAQSEAVTGETFSCTWVHVGMVGLHGEKMAKSTGNAVFVRDLLGRYSPDGLRLYLLSEHYRDFLDFDEADLERREHAAAVLAAAARVKDVAVADDEAWRGSLEAFEAAMDDDLATPAAIAAMTGFAETLLNGRASYRSRSVLRKMAWRLGLTLETRTV
jgi:L-cysteine:1D-myo-inositol 2-amino-2-deoxy-alpha-D-glucopyranoside ligase